MAKPLTYDIGFQAGEALRNLSMRYDLRLARGFDYRSWEGNLAITPNRLGQLIDWLRQQSSNTASEFAGLCGYVAEALEEARTEEVVA